jgi:hypothetical protein
MRSCVILLSFLALSAAALTAQTTRPASAPAAQPAIEGMDKAMENLMAEADEFFKAANDKAPAPSQALSGISYNADNLPALLKLLGAKHGNDSTDLYVNYQLLLPLKSAGPELLRRLKPTLATMIGRKYAYRDLPKWPKEKLAALAFNTGAVSPDEIKLMEKRQKALDEKFAEEGKILKHNRAYAALLAVVKNLMIAMNDSGADDAMLARLSAEEPEASLDYAATLEAIKAHASEFKQPRAKKFFDALVADADKSEPMGKYTDKTGCDYSKTDNSKFLTQNHYFSIESLIIANMLAKSAGTTEARIPDTKTLQDLAYKKASARPPTPVVTPNRSQH